MPNPAEIVARLSIEEKAALSTGATFWNTAAIDSASLPAIMVTDGPHGLRKQTTGGDHLGLLEGVPATCYPPAVALASSWNPALAEQVGDAIAREAKAEQVSVVLGPGVNIKRSIRCGRNFEYFSEDPLLSGHLGAAWVKGVQANGIGTSLKHFAANNQETERLRISSEVSQRSLREIYLKAFHHVVTTQKPWTVMSSYNAINGVNASENQWLLTEVLREEWGFEGIVISDWGAVHDRVEALKAGLDLEMPATGGRTAGEVVAAVTDGSLSAAVLDRSATRMVDFVQKSAANLDLDASYDAVAHHQIARDAALEGLVLLKNEADILPLNPATGSIAVIGEFARTPRYQGAGSSQINPTALDNAVDELTRQATGASISFAAGFRLDGAVDEVLAAEAVVAASSADTVLLFLGLPSSEESEGFDREHIELPAVQTELLQRVVAANARVVVVLSNGSVVRVSGWAAQVPAILEGWLLGQGGGWATAYVVFGTANPSGKLTETIPVQLEDTPDFLDFPGDAKTVQYGEGIFAGYRYYDKRSVDVSYPFGHGLSYTSYEYSHLEVSTSDAAVAVTLDVSNTGDRDGQEVVQVYLGLPNSAVSRAVRELRGFAKVSIAAGATERVEIIIPREELAYYSERGNRFVVEGGDYSVAVGASSRDIRLTGTTAVSGDGAVVPLSMASTIGEWLANPIAGPAVLAGMVANGFGLDHPLFKMAEQMPIRNITMFPGSSGVEEMLAQLEQLAELANA